MYSGSSEALRSQIGLKTTEGLTQNRRADREFLIVIMFLLSISCTNGKYQTGTTRRAERTTRLWVLGLVFVACEHIHIPPFKCISKIPNWVLNGPQFFGQKYIWME